MRIWLLLVLLALLPAAAVPSTESYHFKLPPTRHLRLTNGAPAYSYGTEWSIEIPAPSRRPVSVDLSELSTYVYKYIAFNPSMMLLKGDFTGIVLRTEFELEGVFLGVVEVALPDLEYELQLGEVFWGYGRPKVTKKVQGSVSRSGDWPSPSGDSTWTLKVRAVSHFSAHSTGPVWFGQSLRQRVKGQVQYTF